MKHRSKTGTAMVLALLSLLLSACASPGAGHPRGTPAPSASAEPLLRQGDPIAVHLRSETTDIALLDLDALRIADKIHRAYAPAGASPTVDAERYEIDVAIVNYSTGYDYIRAMTPYVGQVRIDALVRVVRFPEGRQIGLLKVSKTFDPREVTGAASRIDDIEEPFVQSVVDALQGVADVGTHKAGA